MGQPGKVVWHEGMFLAPHHFQQWDQYYGQLLQERLRVVNPFGWGLMAVRLDADDLANNIVRILALRGVLPDGTVISVAAGEENGSLLEPRPIDRYFPPPWITWMCSWEFPPSEPMDRTVCSTRPAAGRLPAMLRSGPASRTLIPEKNERFSSREPTYEFCFREKMRPVLLR